MTRSSGTTASTPRQDTAPPPPGGRAPAIRPRRRRRRRGRRGRRTRAPTAARRLRAGAWRHHADRGQARDGRRAARGARRAAARMIVSEYRGLTVKEIAEIRRALRKQDVTYRVVKNRLMRIAASDTVGEAARPAPRSGRRRSRSATTRSATAKAVIDATRPYASRQDHGRRARRPGDRRRRASRGSPPCRRARSCWRSWPAGCRPRSRRLAGLFAAPLRDMATRWSQVADQKAAARRPATRRPRHHRPRP